MTEMTKNKKLTELNVRPGDVVRHKEGVAHTIAGYGPGGYFPANRFVDESLIDAPVWHIVSRFNKSPESTREDLEAQIAALQAKLDAMPKVMRLWIYKTRAHGWLVNETFMADATHYLNIPVDADGVPIGLKVIKK